MVKTALQIFWSLIGPNELIGLNDGLDEVNRVHQKSRTNPFLPPPPFYSCDTLLF